MAALLLARENEVRLVDWTNMLQFEADKQIVHFFHRSEIEFLPPEIVSVLHTSAGQITRTDVAEVNIASDVWSIGVIAYFLCVEKNLSFLTLDVDDMNIETRSCN